MAETALSNYKSAQRLVERIKTHFGGISHTRYWLRVAYYEPFHGYNVFFNIKRSRMFTRSIPVGEYDYCDFERLVAILKEFRQTYHFTIEFVGFTKDQLHQLYEKRLI